MRQPTEYLHSRSQMARPDPARAFTLVELLVVITIIGILIALLLPAVQAAREAARRMQCANNLKQLAMGCLNHESAQGFWPTGGWGPGWAADPDQGFNKNQPGCWLFTILPYIEQESLFNMAAGQPGWPVPASKQTKIAEMNRVPVAAFFCPTRRSPAAVPCRNAGYLNADNTVRAAAFNDYAACCGAVAVPGVDRVHTTYTAATDSQFRPASEFDGISFVHSQVSVAEVTDGTSNTFMIGDKYLTADWSEVLDDSALSGYTGGSHRSSHSNWPPAQDTPGVSTPWNFGSAHASIFNMAMCDGSVHSISYTIDLTSYERLGSRNDGRPIDNIAF